MYKIEHGLPNFPWDAVFAAPTVLGFVAMIGGFTNGGVIPGVASMLSALG